jgi:hypothetical protein
MVEIAIVLGIIGIVLGAIWGTTRVIHENQRINTAVDQIGSILKNMRALYANRGEFESGPFTAAAANARVFSPDMMGTNNLPVNPWRTTTNLAAIISICPDCGVGVGTMTGWGLSGATPVLHNQRVLQIGYWGIPREAAIGVLAHFIGKGAGNDVLGVYCDGMGGVLLNPSTVTINQLACINGIAATDGSNTVVYFRK